MLNTSTAGRAATSRYGVPSTPATNNYHTGSRNYTPPVQILSPESQAIEAQLKATENKPAQSKAPVSPSVPPASINNRPISVVPSTTANRSVTLGNTPIATSTPALLTPSTPAANTTNALLTPSTPAANTTNAIVTTTTNTSKQSPRKLNTDVSVVDYLVSKGQKFSKADRAKLAQELGIENYNYSGKQNLELLRRLKERDNKPVEVTPTSPPATILAETQIPSMGAINPTKPSAMADLHKRIYGTPQWMNKYLKK